MRIVFLGTPDFAVPSLLAMVSNGYSVVAVFSQPDRPKGRGNKLAMPPVKEAALQHGIPVFQCEKIRQAENVSKLKELKPDLMVTAAFGQILSKEILDIPPLGCVNVHASLLPKYRGSSPIQWAIINGETETGITTMYTSLGVDQGDMILQKKTPILPDETAGGLFGRLSLLGAEVLLETLGLIRKGTAPRIPQNEAEATRCPMLTKETGRIDWDMPPQQIINLIRGVSPWPGAYAKINGMAIKIWKASYAGDKPDGAAPGEIICADREHGIIVCCFNGLLRIDELQLPGGRRMSGSDYLAGNNLSGRFER
ncbi:MAG: methionyl-tRNA formyltransferase [Christensenellales bacterium]